MKIKRVEIFGFKSFVDRVALDFQEGITTVVGPNGCGKSNIVDSIRWAMGEQNAKNLRGRAMEDVIFGGSESRKPLGMAEVSLTFSNAQGIGPPAFRDYAEIMVTRRLYRNGDSEYLLNQTPCRLLDISEFFMDTGVGARAYSIIEQGKIGMILNSKPEDRRFLIEEAAGVTKYKSRKKAALRKIEATKQNLLRLGDIVSEVRRQMNSLKRQAQKAERFRAIREELKAIELALSGDTYRAKTAEREQLELRARETQQMLEALDGELTAGELRQEESRLLQAGREKELSAAQERVYQATADIQKMENRLEACGRDLDHLQRQRQRLGEESIEIERRLEELAREEEGLRQNQSALGAGLASEVRRLGEGEACLEELTAGEKELATRLEQARQGLFSVLTDLSRLGSNLDEAQRRGKSLEERTRRNRSEAVGLREQSAETQRRSEDLTAVLGQLRQEQAVLVQARDALQEQLQVLRRQGEENERALLKGREELNRHRSRLETLTQLEQSLDGYGQGVKALLGEGGFRQRLGPMTADVMEVPSRLEVAVEAVLGERLQALVGAGGDDLQAALQFLRQGEGRCTFLLPMPVSALATAAVSVPGGRLLSEAIQLRPDFAEALGNLLAGIYVVEELEPYLETGLPAGVTLVTESGETLGFRGDLTGGGRESLNRGVLQKKREIKELSAQVAALDHEVANLERSRVEIRDSAANADNELRETGAAIHRLELRVVDVDKDLFRLQQELTRQEERLEVLCLEEDQLHEEQLELERQLAAANTRRDELDRCRIEQEETVARLQEELRIQRQELDVVREQVTALKVLVAGIREREEADRRQLERIERLRSDFQQQRLLLGERLLEGEREEERLQQESLAHRGQLEEGFRRLEAEKQAFEQSRSVFDDFAQQLEEQTEGLKALRRRSQQIREELNALQWQGRELEMELQSLQQAIFERHRVELSAVLTEIPPLELPEIEGRQRRLEELRSQVADFGEVNLMAVEEFQELEERYHFLSTQQQDLQASLDGLQTAIAKINRTTRKRFRETFDLVNTTFQEVFPRLFRGGKAELRLTDESDLLETGIEIVAQPPGKKLQNVSLLSGGEKALTAVALIFSIFLIKPSPFCLLDEVDAPLDDANIGRFNEMVREMSNHSQFIIITHNKRTMEIADTLYGITMEEPGVSKLVSVRLNEFQ